MMTRRPTIRLALALALALLGMPATASAQPAPPAAAVRDGSHDFDFNVGTWRTRLVRLKAPLSGSKETVTLTGTVTIDKFWDGQGLYEQIEADGPNGRWQGMTLFLYNPASGQWSQRFAGAADGRLQPAVYGGRLGDRVELYGQDDFDGRFILVRSVWSDLKPDSHTYQESFSTDGGQSWEVQITAHLTRIAPVAQPAHPASSDGAHDFDFDHGNWRTRSSRMAGALTGKGTWSEWDGGTRVLPLWGGRANLAFFATQKVGGGPADRLELISLRLFDPQAKQWSLNFARRGDGQWSVPMVGEFRDGRGTFHDQEEIGGRQVLVRFTFLDQGTASARSEQAFSADGGKTWETNWINRYTRAGADSAPVPSIGGSSR